MIGPFRHTFERRKRLLTKPQFDRVYAEGRATGDGPLVFRIAFNDLDHPRLGLSVPKRVGAAPKRNLIKRRLREAFRLMQHDFPQGYDLVINVKPHQPLTLAEYQKLMSRCVRKLISKSSPPDNP